MSIYSNREVLNKKTVSELKGILKENSLKVSGNKSVLIDRIIQELGQDEKPTEQKPTSLPPLSGSSLPPLKSTLKIPQEPFKPQECDQPPPNLEKDPRKHLDTFFGVRNGIKGNPVEGVNYTQETLTYMLSQSRADQITNIIIDRMKGKKFPIYECCTGIGGSTMGFLDNAFGPNPSITHVTTYECDISRRQMFRNNVAMYQFDKEDKLTIPDVPFTGVPKDVPNAVFVADPPWLPSDVKGQKSSKDQYLLSGITLSGKTLEEWIADCKHCALSVIRVPPGYKLKPVPGFEHEELMVKNSMLIISKPTVATKASLLKEQYSKNQELQKEKEKEWRDNLKNYLRNELLPRALSNPEYLDKLVDDEAMETWVKVFTSKDYSPNIDENYEVLELLGDKLLGYLYVKYMNASYPDLNQSQLSVLGNYYLGKVFLSQMSSSIGLGNHIRSRLPTTIHMLEDVFEAMFAGLEITGNRIKNGVGPGLAYNLLVSLFDPIEVDWAHSLGNPKTTVKEIFEGLGWVDPKGDPSIGKAPEKVPEKFFKDADGRTTFTVSLNAKGAEQLRGMGFPISTLVLGTATQPTKKAAETEAYFNALVTLQNMGITREWMQELREKRDYENPDLAPYFASIVDRMRSEGIVKTEFNDIHVKGKIGGLTTGKYVQLIGIDEQGNKRVLAMTAEPVENVLFGKQSVLTDYASYSQ